MDSRLTKKLNELYRIQRDLDYLNNQKQMVKREVENLIVDNRLHNKKLSIGDRYIIYRKTETNQALTQKFLSDMLLRYFSDEIKAERLMKYILDNRTKKTNYNLEINKKKHL